VFKKHGKRFWATLALVAAIVVFYFPSLLAFRYTADAQSSSFLTHPWRSWDFLFTALTVPGDSRLKTSGAAMRKAEELFDKTQVGVVQVRLLFLPARVPYTFTQQLGQRTVTTRITPPYRFVWQVEGTVHAVSGSPLRVVMLLDYRGGAVLYDITSDLPGVPSTPAPGNTGPLALQDAP
jgi:hypothetical protein